jgi:tRNA-splicing ligase RtcB (3'-phosphate/5'-hydroxy nucleic acid ligase)
MKREPQAPGRFSLRRINPFEFRIDKENGMNAPVTLYSNDALITKMQTDRTIGQAVNVAHLPGVEKHVIVLPDGHEGYGFPIGGVAATNFESWVISPGGVGYDINCLPPDTEVLTPLGFRIRIDSVTTDNEVTCFGSLGQTQTKVCLTLKRSANSLIRIRTKTGVTLRATSDHPVLTKTGMTRAESLCTGTVVATHPFRGVDYDPPERITVIDAANFAPKIRTNLRSRKLLPLLMSNKKFPYLVKLLGYFLGDGCFDGKKTWFYGSYDGVKQIQKDIERMEFTPSPIQLKCGPSTIAGKHFDGIEYSVCVSAWSFRKLLEALGAPSGRKTECDYDVPIWLRQSPLWIKRLFLAAYCGAKMNKPQTIDGYNFEPPVISMNKNQVFEESGEKFLSSLASLFVEFGVAVNGIHKEDLGDKVRLKLQLSERPDSLLHLYSSVGYIYEPIRQALAVAAVSWLSWKSSIINERKQAALVAVTLHNSGHSMSSVQSEIGSSRVNTRFSERGVREGRGTDLEAPSGFPYFEDWTSNNLDGEVVWNEIEEIEIEQYQGEVYDITVEDDCHNFVANGMIVSNCGVRLLRTSLDETQVRSKLKELVREIYRSVPSGLGNTGALNLSTGQLDRVLSEGAKWAVDSGYGVRKDLEHCEEKGTMVHSDSSRVSGEAKKRGSVSLGTLGSGNHFLEIETVNRVIDDQAAKVFGISKKNQVCVLMHTGSRGLGHQVCSDYLRIVEAAASIFKISLPDRELACAPASSKEAENYRLAMGAALNYAWANRQIITHNVRRAFERVFGMTASDLEMDLVYDVAHNICKVEEHYVDFSNPKKKRKVFVHRKGATRAFPKNHPDVIEEYRAVGQPVLIPGSMGTASWVLLGQEASMEKSFGSTAHGAGRNMSRGAATRAYPYDMVRKDLESKGIVIEAASKKGVAEEAPGAYKDVDAVADVSDSVGIATKVIRLTPIGVVKG